MVFRGFTVKQAAVYRKAELENVERQERDQLDPNPWSARVRLLVLLGAALVSWLIVGLVGYGLYSLLS